MAVRIAYNLAAFRELRTSPAVWADIMRRAQAVADAAGEGYEAKEMAQSKTRARAIVYPETYEAAVDNSENQTLLRALEAGR